MSSRNVSVLTSFRRQSPPIATEKFCERKNENKRECCVRFIISPLCNLFLIIIIIVIIFTVLAIRLYFLPIFILFRSVTFLPFVRVSFLFIFLYSARPSRLQRSRVENRVGPKYIVNPRISFILRAKKFILDQKRRGLRLGPFRKFLRFLSNSHSSSCVNTRSKHSVRMAMVHITQLRLLFGFLPYWRKTDVARAFSAID